MCCPFSGCHSRRKEGDVPVPMFLPSIDHSISSMSLLALADRMIFSFSSGIIESKRKLSPWFGFSIVNQLPVFTSVGRQRGEYFVGGCGQPFSRAQVLSSGGKST